MTTTRTQFKKWLSLVSIIGTTFVPSQPALSSYNTLMFMKGPPRLVQTTGKVRVASASSLNASFSSLPKVGNTIVVLAWNWHSGSYSTFGTTSVTDNQTSNTYSRATFQGHNDGGVNYYYVGVYTGQVQASSGTFTITVTPSQSSTEILYAAFEYEGLVANPVDKTKCSTGNSAAPSTGASATTTHGNELLVGVTVGGAAGANPQNWTPPAGWTALVTETDSNSYQAGQAIALVVSTSAAYTAASSISSGGYWASCMATLKGF